MVIGIGIAVVAFIGALVAVLQDTKREENGHIRLNGTGWAMLSIVTTALILSVAKEVTDSGEAKAQKDQLAAKDRQLAAKDAELTAKDGELRAQQEKLDSGAKIANARAIATDLNQKAFDCAAVDPAGALLLKKRALAAYEDVYKMELSLGISGSCPTGPARPPSRAKR